MLEICGSSGKECTFPMINESSSMTDAPTSVGKAHLCSP